MEDINNTANMPEENKQEIFVADGVRNNSFIKESGVKIFILTLLFGIFYPIGYFYKQWKAIKLTNEKYKNISPFWRGVFYPIYAFSFMGIIRKSLAIKKENDLQNCQNEEEKKTIEKKHKSNIILTYALPLGLFGVILSTLGKMLVQRTDWPIYAIIIFIVLYCSQTIINFVLPKNHAKGKITFADFLGVFPWVLYMLLSLILLFASYFSNIRIEGTNLIDKKYNYSFALPFGNNEIVKYDDNGEYCQSENDLSETNMICAKILICPTKTFNLDFLEKYLMEEFGISTIQSKTEIYKGNTAHCFYGEKEGNNYHICFLKPTKDPLLTWQIITNEDDPTNLEKIMNSYKTW